MFYFYHFMLVALLEFKLSSLNNTRKNPKLTTDFYNFLNLSLARGFDFLLSLSVTTPLIIQLIGISWFFMCWRDCFHMLKSLGLGDMVRLFSNFRPSNKVYLGWLVWDLVERLFKMQASRQSVKPYSRSGCIGPSLNTAFQVYVSKSWDKS